jgi:hypothetical protein
MPNFILSVKRFQFYRGSKIACSHTNSRVVLMHAVVARSTACTAMQLVIVAAAKFLRIIVSGIFCQAFGCFRIPNELYCVVLYQKAARVRSCYYSNDISNFLTYSSLSTDRHLRITNSEFKSRNYSLNTSSSSSDQRSVDAELIKPCRK